MLQDEICPQCGHPVWLCRSKSDNIGWTVQQDTCYASRVRDEKEWRSNNPKKTPDPKDRKSWGRYTYTLPKISDWAPEGAELPTRKEYYESLANGG